MNLTPDQLRQNAAAMIAHADGKPVQIACIGKNDWQSYSKHDAPSWDFQAFEYRPKPEPNVRPWSKPEDVPINCWLRSSDGSPEMLVSCVFKCGLSFHDVSTHYDKAWCDLRSYNYSTDRKTWHPCTVEEPA